MSTVFKLTATAEGVVGQGTGPDPTLLHDHAEYVEGCFRCDLGRIEFPPITKENDQ